MKTNTLNRSLAALLCLGLTLGTAFGQKDNPQTTPNQRNEQGHSDPTSAQHFVWEAGWGGLKEIRLSQIALQRSSDPEIRQFAQRMITEHKQVNHELRDIAQRKGLDVPSKVFLLQTNQYGQTLFGTEVERSVVTRDDVKAQTQAERKDSADKDYPSASSVPTNVRITQGDVTPREAGQRKDSADKDYPAQNQSAGVIHHAHAQVMAIDAVRALEAAPQDEFDHLYVVAMREDHAAAVRKFELAAQKLTDAELKEFATAKLPALREHLSHAKALGKGHTSYRDNQVTAVDP